MNIKKIQKKIYVGITILIITIVWLSILIYIDKNQKTDLLIYNGILFLITFIYLSFREVIKKIKISNQIIKFSNTKNILNLLFFFYWLPDSRRRARSTIDRETRQGPRPGDHGRLEQHFRRHGD
ncbi:MAG: hypothetical protein Q8769_01145, partial [Candidatus Phytoplasma australasiaticum]|nr:hypothetical protein [Candidatus Phytoplasma australasiaticum]